MHIQPKFLSIVGHNSLLNQTIQFTIRDLLVTYSVPASVFQFFEEVNPPPGSASVILVDNTDRDARTTLLRRLEGEGTENITAALFNIEPDDEAACSAVTQGVRGLFFLTDTISSLIEGIEQLLTENVWIPKEILLRAVLKRRHDPDTAIQAARLTMREMQILAHVCTGATNDQIASVLCISSHTVKTHMYNIFPKIGVKNRLHAALWATANIRSHIDYLSAARPVVNPDDVDIPWGSTTTKTHFHRVHSEEKHEIALSTH